MLASPLLFNSINTDILIKQCEDEVFKKSNALEFVKSTKFSPDGTQLLSTTEDNRVIIHHLDPTLINQQRYFSFTDSPSSSSSISTSVCALERSQTIPTGESIYDASWHTSCSSFISTCRDHPVQLWDAATGTMLCSYVGHNHLDELDTATVVTFNLQGTHIYAGSMAMIRIFDVENPGVYCDKPTFGRRSKEDAGYGSRKALVSALAFNPDYCGAYAAGSYASDTGISIYVENQEDCVLGLRNLDFGVTCLRWSPDGVALWAGGRNHADLVCWDLRHTREELGRVKRALGTQQKFSFDLDPWGEYLVTGSQEGDVHIYNAKTFALESSMHRACADATNSISLHPFAALMAVSSGQRHFDDVPVEDDSDSDSEDEEEQPKKHRSTDRDIQSAIQSASAKFAQPSCVSVWSMLFSPIRPPLEHAGRTSEADT